MAAGAYSAGVHAVVTGVIDVDTDTLKLMLVDSGYTYDPDHALVDNGGNNATDLSFNELTATNYTAGFAGAGRKTLTVTQTQQPANNRTVTIFDDQTWTALGGAVNDTVQAAVVIFEVTVDTDSIPIVFLDFSGGAVVTNGSNFTTDMDGVNGNLRWAV